MTSEQSNEASIFNAARKIEAATERSAFLDHACGEDSGLRERVEKLLTAFIEESQFLEQPAPGLEQSSSPLRGETLDPTIAPDSTGKNFAASLDAGLSATFGEESAVVIGNTNHSVLKSMSASLTEIPRVSLRPPKEEGDEPIQRPSSPEIPNQPSDSRYRLDGEIARGGMGAVLRGRDTDLGRDLAVKVLLDAHKDKPEVVQRFIEEAQIGGQLQHPGIAPVYELGQFADQRPFFSMKLVKGDTLSKLLSDREDPTADRSKLIGIFEQVCQTMAYAHSRGVIHRDLKPANIMVGAFGEVQVMDWGLAKVLSVGGVADEKTARRKQNGETMIQTMRSVGSDAPGSVGSAGSETQMGSVMGTPAYMPPEQALGEIDMLDQRADVFGLGAILAEILTGKPPYVADDATQIYRMASRGKLAECFTRLDECGVDAELVLLAKQCLEVEPADRPNDAKALAECIGEYLASVETRMRDAELAKVEANARAIEERKRRRVILGLAASILTTFCVAGGGWLWVKQKDAELAQVEATQQIKEMAERQQLAQQINGELSTARALAKLDEDTLPTEESVVRAQAAIKRAQALLETGDVDDQTKVNTVTLAKDIESIRKDFDLISALDVAWQKEVDHKTQRASWARVNQKRGNASNAQGAASNSNDDGPNSDEVAELFPLNNPAEHYERAFTDWGLSLDRKNEDEAVEKLKALSSELQSIAFSSLDRWRSLLRAPREIEEWQQLEWSVLKPVETKSNKHDTFKVLNDQSVLASGPTPYAGYELVFDTDVTDLSALRLEAMLHDSLPNRGPGRSSTGSFRTDIQVHYAPLDDIANRSPLKLGLGTSDFKLSEGFVAEGVWNIFGSAGRSHVAVYPIVNPVSSDKGFRIWVTSQDRDSNHANHGRWGRCRFSLLNGDVELRPRLNTVDQLRRLADSADANSWRQGLRKEIDSDNILDAIKRAISPQKEEASSQDRIRLSEFLASRDNRQLVAHWPEEVSWYPLTDAELTAENGTLLSQTDDGIIHASGPNPNNENITVTANLPVEQVSMVRLEVLTDQEPNSGKSKLGRNGDVYLHELDFSVGDADRSRFQAIEPNFLMARQEKGTAHTTSHLYRAVDGFDSTFLMLFKEAPHDRVFLYGMPREASADAKSMRLRTHARRKSGCESGAVSYLSHRRRSPHLANPHRRSLDLGTRCCRRSDRLPDPDCPG